MASSGKFIRFSLNIWLISAIFIFLGILFGIYVRAEKQIDYYNELRLHSFLLTDKLRHSSDDLSHIALSYVLTNNPVYKQHYQEILDIRDGKRPVANDGQQFSRNLTLPEDQTNDQNGQSIALLERIRLSGFSETELLMLKQAKADSDKLAAIDIQAMNLVDSTNPPSPANRLQASQFLQNQAYNQAKSAMIQAISEVFQLMDKRTLSAVRAAELAAIQFRWVFVACSVFLVILLWRTYRMLLTTLGSPLDIVHAHIMRLGTGDFSTQIPVQPSAKKSVMAWLADTQLKLAQMQTEHYKSEEKIHRLTKFYAALSQCNQAIVRCNNETELFPQICRDAVIFGGMKMAWIGIVDEQTKLVKPVAAYGEGKDYLSNILISIDSSLDYGQGPTGTAIRENRPYWCQDFQQDPSTILWRDQAARYNWQASASLPLLRNDKVIGAFSLYATETHAFDEAGCNLLMEMAMDISYALKGFEREIERQQSMELEHFRTFMLELLTGGLTLKLILNAVVLKLESMLPDCRCSILLLDADGYSLRLGAAPNLPEFYNTAVDGLQIGSGIGCCGNTVFLGVRTIAEDISVHPYWENYKHLAAEAGIASCWSEPVLSAGAKVLGSFAIYQQKVASPEPYHLRLLEMAAHLVALAIERKQAEEHIYHLANFDPLTKLPNRTQLNDHLKFALGLTKRSSGNLALMFLDIDHFKDINDTLGHSVGDALLIELAQRFKLTLREEDTVTRLGGDEFIFLLPGVDSRGAANVAQKLLDAIALTYSIEHYELSLTASIGIALYPFDGEDLETLSKSADTAMYRAKQEGRRGYRFFTPAMQAQTKRNLELVHALQQALEHNQFQVYYQPQVAIADQRIIGAEALLRWQHPELGMISPAEFIPIAEESSLILPIGEWVLRSAVRQTKAWLEQGYAPITIAVNLSAVQFRHPDLPNMVSRILADAGLPAEYLELELTEGVAMHNPQDVIAIIDNLYQRGIRMSIDDFGTGYSSLSYLKKFKVYKLKIDQSFVQDINTDPEDKAIVKAVISLAKSLGLKTIAEGVETEQQLAFLYENECDEIQGYLYSKPLTAEEFSIRRDLK